MSGAIHPFPQYAFMAWCSVKAQRQLYLCLMILIQTQRLFSTKSYVRMIINGGFRKMGISSHASFKVIFILLLKGMMTTTENFG
jgi:hypothetical protein